MLAFSIMYFTVPYSIKVPSKASAWELYYYHTVKLWFLLTLSSEPRTGEGLLRILGQRNSGLVLRLMADSQVRRNVLVIGAGSFFVPAAKSVSVYHVDLQASLA